MDNGENVVKTSSAKNEATSIEPQGTFQISKKNGISSVLQITFTGHIFTKLSLPSVARFRSVCVPLHFPASLERLHLPERTSAIQRLDKIVFPVRNKRTSALHNRQSFLSKKQSFSLVFSAESFHKLPRYPEGKEGKKPEQPVSEIRLSLMHCTQSGLETSGSPTPHKHRL